MNFSKIQPYLPSKKFQTIFFGVLVLVLVIFLINLFISNKKTFKNKSSLSVKDKTLYEIRTTDSDYDGLYDWEEKLWGTDPNNKLTFNNEPDLQYVNKKKASLNTENQIKEQEINETQKFTQEFLSNFFALKTTQGVSQQDINNFSQLLGENIVNQKIIDQYNISAVKTTKDTTKENQINYYLEMKKLFESYQNKGIGDELEITSKSLVSYTNEGKISNNNELLLISNLYLELAKDALNVVVPENLKEEHLNIVNASNNVGKSVLDMAKVIEDPIVGLTAISKYEESSQILIDNVSELENQLEKLL